MFMEFQCRVIVQRRCTSCCSSVENIPLQAERQSGGQQKLFAFPPESAFTFRPECCSESQRNRVRLQSGIAFAFDRIPHAAAKFGVEGFSESLSKEVGPLGIKVTIVEPGGFRTDFAGSSTELREGRPEYDATVGATVRFQREYDGKQPGDPIKAAEAILYVASLSEPPLRLLLGSDSYNAAEKHTNQILATDREWKNLSISTDRSF